MGNEVSFEDLRDAAGDAVRDNAGDAVEAALDRSGDDASDESDSGSSSSSRGGRRRRHRGKGDKRRSKGRRGKKHRRRRHDDDSTANSSAGDRDSNSDDDSVSEDTRTQRLREQRRRRRANFRHERELEDKKFEARKKAEPLCGCCAGSDSDETPTDPGSDFSDRNFYTAPGSRQLRRRHRRGGDDREPFDEPGYGGPGQPAEDDAGEAQTVTDRGAPSASPQLQAGCVAVPRAAAAAVLSSIESRERCMIQSTEEDVRTALGLHLRSGAGIITTGTTAGPAAASRDSAGAASDDLAAACGVLLPQPGLPLMSKVALARVGYKLTPAGGADVSDPDSLSFDVSGVQLGDDAAFLAAQTLRAQTHLTTIALGSTGLTSFGLCVLAMTIRDTNARGLRVLDVSGNHVTFEGTLQLVQALCDVFPFNRTSKHGLAVSFEDNEGVWHTTPGNRQALAERVQRLQQSNVTVTLPDPPPAE